MLAVLFLIPVCALVAILLLYPHVAKREFLRFDLVQFVYGFVIFPLMYIWLKSFMYYFLRHQSEVQLSTGDVLVVDGFLSLIFLYIYAFVIIHSLTKSFKEKKLRDPLYDMFAHSEWFHLYASHLFIYLGLVIVFTLISLANIAVPMVLVGSRSTTLGLMSAGFAFGLLAYGGIWLSDFWQGHFMRILKLAFALSFTLQVVAYFIATPSLSLSYAFFWTIFMGMVGIIVCALAFDRSEKPETWFGHLKHRNWGINIQLFPHKKH